MVNTRKFHPGEHLKDSLAALEMTAKEFSTRTGISERTISALINGNGDITFDIAYKLANFFDTSIDLWTNLQNQYNLYIKEQEYKLEIQKDWELIKPLKQYFIENTFINKTDDHETIVLKIRKLIGVNYLFLLDKQDSIICYKKINTPINENFFYKNFWIALALKEARKRSVKEFNKSNLLNYIPELRLLTLKDPQIFLPRLFEIFSECGISFVIVPYLPKSNIYGITKWLNKNNVIIAISNRGEKGDLFWFTIFHEIAHVLMEHKREALVNVDGIEDSIANEMAENMLIPLKKWNSFIKNNIFTIESIQEFSKEIEIHPCIILGRLHKELPTTIPYGKFDKFLGVSYKIY